MHQKIATKGFHGYTFYQDSRLSLLEPRDLVPLSSNISNTSDVSNNRKNNNTLSHYGSIPVDLHVYCGMWRFYDVQQKKRKTFDGKNVKHDVGNESGARTATMACFVLFRHQLIYIWR